MKNYWKSIVLSKKANYLFQRVGMFACMNDWMGVVITSFNYFAGVDITANQEET